MKKTVIKTVELVLTEEEVIDCIIKSHIEDVQDNEKVVLASAYQSLGEYNFKIVPKESKKAK